MHDVRLALGGLAGWSAVWWGLGHSAAAVGVFAGAALLLVPMLALAQRRADGTSVASLLGALAFMVCCAVVVLGPLGVRLHTVQSSPLTRLAKTKPAVRAELVVRGDPRPLAAAGPNGARRSIVDGRLTAVEVRGRRQAMSGSVLLFVPSDSWSGVLPGQRLRVDATLLPPRGSNLLSASVAVNGAPQLIGQPPWWQRQAGALRAGLRQASASLPAEVRGLLPGIVDGDTTNLDPILNDHFRTAGLTHLVAVSGTNCSIMVGIVALVLVRARASPGVVAAVSLVVLVGFVIVARPSPSVLRAAVMAAIGLLATATGRQRSAVPALGATVLALLIWQPTLAQDLGFMLSVAATAALLLVAPGWAAALRRGHVPAGLAEAIAVAAAAHVVTAPLIAAVSGRFSLVAIPANILAEPVVAPATVLGVLAAAVSVVCLPVAQALAWLAGWPCRWLVFVANQFGAIPGAQLPWPAGLVGAASMALVTGTMLVFLRRGLGKLVILVAATCGLVIQFPVRGIIDRWPAPGWLVTACDVGQGDAVVLHTGGSSAVLVDAGPDAVAVDRCLRGLGITRIPLLVISHFHLDHVGGIAGAVHGRGVDQVFVSPMAEPLTGSRMLEQALGQHRDRVSIPHAGQQVTVGAGRDAVQITVLGPDHAFHNTRSDPNNSSLVLMAVSHGRRILLTGDADVEAQDALLASGADLRADVLKIPHHGSAYTDPAFLAAVHARVALISVGAGNDYGHPSPLLIEALGRFGMTGYRTDQLGDVAVVAARGGVQVVARPSTAATARSPPRRTALSDARGTMTPCRSQPCPLR